MPYEGPERRRRKTAWEVEPVEPVVLRQKLADVIDGVSLKGYHVGDRLPLGRREARLLVAEGWASPTPIEQRRRSNGAGGGPES